MHCLECPCCGEDGVFEHKEPLWYDGEQEVCPDCGCHLTVSVDEHENIAYVNASEDCEGR
jgi:hypothetical protein